MISPVQSDIIRKVTEIYELSYELMPDIRFGQMIDFMGFLGQDMFDRPLVDIEDESFLKVFERHLSDLENVKQRRVVESESV